MLATNTDDEVETVCHDLLPEGTAYADCCALDY